MQICNEAWIEIPWVRIVIYIMHIYFFPPPTYTLKKTKKKKLLITFNLLLYIYCNQLVLWNQVLKMASFHFNFFSNVCVRIMIITLQYEHFWFQKQQLLICCQKLRMIIFTEFYPHLLNLQFWKNPKVLQTFLEKNWWKIFQLF